MIARLPTPTVWSPEDVWDWFVGTPSQVLLVLVVGLVARWIGLRAIRGFVSTTVAKGEAARAARGGSARERAINRAAGLTDERHRQRTLTMGSLLSSVLTVVVAVLTVLTVMGVLGIPLAPLLASAGVGGVALGFGAQSLVKDYLSGIFMILEDQYGVGDLIDAGDAVGTVEEVTLRVTRLRDPQGVVWYIRNGEIIRVANRSQGWSTAMVDIPFSYREDVERVIAIIGGAVAHLHEDPRWGELLLEEPQVLGVEAISSGTVTVRVLAKCSPDQHWGVQREIRRRVKEAFDRDGIAGPPISVTGVGGGTP